MIVIRAASSHQNSEVEEAEAGSDRRHEGDGDGHADEQHHPGLTGPELGDGARRKGQPP